MNKQFDVAQAITTITRFITGQLNRSGLSGYVVGLSGGIDSAVSCALAVKALGPEKVLGVSMPYRSSSASSRSDAAELIAQLGIDSRVVDISPMIDAYYAEITDNLKLRAGNKMARERMAVLFDVSAETGRMVLGTGNRTEICLGYTTLYGDSACSINPIGELYKSELREVARALEIPQSIIDKAPSADLWAGQTDEGEIGVSYETIDRILHEIVDNEVRSMKALEGLGLNSADISRVVSRINLNAFKRRLPPVAPLGKTAVPDVVQLDS